MKECGKGGEGVGESGKEWYFCLSVGKSGKKGEGVGGCGKEWVGFIKPRKEQGLPSACMYSTTKFELETLSFHCLVFLVLLNCRLCS